MAHPPPVAVGVGLVPIGADAGFASAAVVEKDGSLADFRPFHRVLPFPWVEAASPNVVLDNVRRMLTFDVAHFAIDNQVVLTIHLFDTKHNDVGGQSANKAEAVGSFDIGLNRTGGEKPEAKN